MTEILVQTHEMGRVFLQGGVPVQALASVTCMVRSGDRIAVMGPSGSGKSTLLHLMAGLAGPTSGSIAWPALGPPETLRPCQVSLVFQAPSLLASLTVLENVALPLLLQGRREGEARVMALDMLEEMGLEPIAEQLPEELSGGQAQRAAMARALVTCPRLILADEPTGQLDQKTAAQMLDLVLKKLDETGTALVLATHDPMVAGRMSEVWRMEHGVLEAGKGVQTHLVQGSV